MLSNGSSEISITGRVDMFDQAGLQGKTIRAEIELSRVIRSSCEEAALVIRLYDLFYDYTRRAEVDPRGWMAGSKWIIAV